MENLSRLLNDRDRLDSFTQPGTTSESADNRIDVETGAEAPTNGLDPEGARIARLPDPVKIRFAEWCESLRPQGALQRYVIEYGAWASWMLDVVREDAGKWRAHLAERAKLSWEVDQQAEAEKQAGRLPKRPALVFRTMKQSKYGCEWLVGRLENLAESVAADPDGGPGRPLDDEGRRRALDLLGVDLAEREGRTRLDLPRISINGNGDGNEPGNGLDLAAHQAAVLAAEVSTLKKHLNEALIVLDEDLRAMVVEGRGNPEDKRMRQILRYEAGYQREVEWSLNQLHLLQKLGKKPGPDESQLISGVRPEYLQDVSPRDHNDSSRTYRPIDPRLRAASRPAPAQAPAPQPAEEPVLGDPGDGLDTDADVRLDFEAFVNTAKSLREPVRSGAVPAAKSADVTVGAPAGRPAKRSKNPEGLSKKERLRRRREEQLQTQSS